MGTLKKQKAKSLVPIDSSSKSMPLTSQQPAAKGLFFFSFTSMQTKRSKVINSGKIDLIPDNNYIDD